MPNLLRSWLLLALLSLPTLTATFSCTKKADDPAPTPGGLAGTLNWTVSGRGAGGTPRTTYTATAFSGTISDQSIYLTAIVNVGGVTDMMTLDIPTGGRPGTFELGGPGYPGAYVTYRRISGNLYGPTYISWSGTGAAGRTGDIVIRTFDARTRTLSGTFEFSAIGYDPDPSVSTIAFINGTFDLRF